MLKLLESLDLLNRISETSNKEEIFEIASKAFDNCSLCLEAAAIVSKTLDDEKEKETFLLTAVNNAQKQIEENKIKDITVLDSLLRGYFELGCMYYNFGRYSKALDYYELVKQLDKDNYYKIIYRLISIYAYFEDSHTEILYKEAIDTNDEYDVLKAEVPYLVYLYKQSNFEEFKTLLSKIKKENETIIEILCGKEDDQTIKSKEACNILRNNAFLFNSCPYILNYIKENND